MPLCGNNSLFPLYLLLAVFYLYNQYIKIDQCNLVITHPTGFITDKCGMASHLLRTRSFSQSISRVSKQCKV